MPPSQRHLVYEHIIEEYGQDKTAYVLAMGTIADKGAIDDIARALALDDGLREKYSLNNTKLIKELYEEDPARAREEYSELFYYFDGLVGTVVSQSMHPAGIIVSPVTLPDNYGTFWSEGKRILCINMEEIHEVSLVKYDLLGLKNIEIIKDCCELAHIPYPKSHNVNWCDEKVWEHITDSPVGIFQFESKYASELLKRYKPTEINSLSMVNAALRPSGESYRDDLLAGKWKKNPSKLIDDLLKSNRGYLIFQEDTLKFLVNICGLTGSEADNIRRAIGRKQKDRLDAALPRILDGYCNMSDKPREQAEAEAKAFLQIIEDSANYQFGHNHSTGYSMIGYMCGWLRYYYPVEFITAYLNNANNDDDIAMGTELAKQLGVKISDIKFGFSISQYSCDADNKIIYKGLSSIKYLSEQMSQELYNLRDITYDNFMDLLTDIKNKTTCNSRQLDILIKLNFFSEFGDINMLLKCTELYDKIYGKKQFKKDKLEELGIPENLIKSVAEKETPKMYSGVDTSKLLSMMIKDIKVKKANIITRMHYQQEFLGYISETADVSGEYYYVQAINGNYITLYQLNSGNVSKIKTRKKYFEENPFTEGKIIKVREIRQEKKWAKDNNGEWYRLDETEEILVFWSILRE